MDWLWFLLPVAATFGWISGYRAKKKNVEKSKKSTNYYKGLNYLLNHQPDRALDVFMRLVENDSETIDTHLALASLFRQRGEIDKATRIHQNLIARPSLDNYQRGLALLELGRDYLAAGLNDRAENLLLELLDDKQHSQDAMASLLEIYQREKDWDKAIELSIRFNSKEKSSHMVAHFYCELGEEKANKGNYMQAIAYARKAENIEKNSIRAKVLQGDIALKQERFVEAARLFMQIIEIDPYHLSEVIGRIRTCIDHSDNGKQLFKDLVKQLNKLDQLPPIKSFTGFLADYEGPDEAESYLERQFEQGEVTTRLLYEWLDFKQSQKSVDDSVIEDVKKKLASLEAKRSDYNCHRCGYHSSQHYWQCPSCKSWDSINYKMV